MREKPSEKYLEEVLDSILAQTYLHFELIISNNPSTDYTQRICRAYATENRRVRYYCNEKISWLPRILTASLSCRALLKTCGEVQ